MSFDIPTIIITIVNFIILVLVLKHFLFKPVNNVIDSRQNDILGSMDKAKKDEEKAELLKIEGEKKLKETIDQGKSIVEDYKKRAEKVEGDLIKDANTEAQLIIERAKKEVEREKLKAQHEIKTQIIDLALLLSSKTIEEAIDEKKHRELIDDFIAKVGI